MMWKDDVYDDLGQFEGRCGGGYIPWVNDYVATNGDLSPVGVVFLGEYLAHNFYISRLLSSVCRYIFVMEDLEVFSSCYPICNLYKCLGIAFLVYCNMILPNSFGICGGAVASVILATPMYLHWGQTWLGMLQEWTRGQVEPSVNIIVKPGMAWTWRLALTVWLDRQVVVNFVCGTWWGVKWADLGQSLWGAPLEVAELVSFVGCATLELVHTATVR